MSPPQQPQQDLAFGPPTPEAEARAAERPATSVPAAPTDVACHRAQALLAAGLASLNEGALEEIGAHLDVCDLCQGLVGAPFAQGHFCPELGPAVDEPQLSPDAALDHVDALETRLFGAIRAEADRIKHLRVSGTRLRPVPQPPGRSMLAAGHRRPFDIRDGHLHGGESVCGASFRFAIRSLIGVGEFTETYAADCYPIEGQAPSPIRSAVVKIPRLSPDLSPDGAAERLLLLRAMIAAHPRSLESLASLRYSAAPIDRGNYVHRFRDQGLESTFIAYDFVEEAVHLETHLVTQPGHVGSFRGLPTAALFAGWARMLTTGVLELHDRMIIHGDICPRNVLVRSDGSAVLVDVGQYLFREVMHGTSDFESFCFRAPEGVRTLSSDIFSLGGLLYFLATGREPNEIGDCTDNEALKRRIADMVTRGNPRLFHDDPGVADIIAMCLRSHGRVRDAAHLLADVETFWPSCAPSSISAELKSVVKAARSLEKCRNALFRFAGSVRLRAIDRELSAMAEGHFDVSGTPEDIRRAAYQLVGTLKSGDEFDTVSLPVFWLARNIGINGRFLTMCRNAAARGAMVRRVFLIDETLVDEHLQAIVSAQMSAVASLDLASRPRLEVRYLAMSAAERYRHVTAGRHFGLLVTQGGMTSMAPIYDADDTLVSLRFRFGERDVAGLSDTFTDFWEQSRPLADLRLPNVSFDPGLVTTATDGRP